MIMDSLLLLDGSVSSSGVFSGTAQSAWTSQPGNNTSANIIDVSQLASSSKGLGRDIGVGDGLNLVVSVIAPFTSGGSPTLQVNLQYAPDSGSGTPGAWVTVVESAVYTLTQLSVTGELLRIALPPMSPAGSGGSAMVKYIQMQYVVGSSSFTAGAISAAIVIDREALGPNQGYQSGYSNLYM